MEDSYATRKDEGTGQMKHVVMYSGGAGSWATAKRVVSTYGSEDVTLAFADTKMEDEDLYRFLEETAADIGVPVTTVADGRTPWDVFFDERYLGNTRIDPCSKILKRKLLRKWLEENYDVEDTVVYLGIDWSEEHRFIKAKPQWEPWTVRAPMCEEPYVRKEQVMTALRFIGIEPPRLYAMGFPHNNCGGFCIKAGMAHFKLLLEKMPERYAYHEQKEQDLREYLDKDIAVLRDRTKTALAENDGKPKPLTLRDFRERVMSNGEIDTTEWGGCGCFSG